MAAAANKRNLYIYAIEFIVLIFVVVVFFSCISFNKFDGHNPWVYPNNATVKNWCGSFGAFWSYYALKYFGAGIFVILASFFVWMLVKLSNKQYSQLILRAVGLVLLTTSVSTIADIFFPQTNNSIMIGNGGILGAACSIFLRENLADFGTYIVLFGSAFVGAFLLADSLVLMLLRWIGIGGGKVVVAAGSAVEAAREHSEQLSLIWQRLSDRQKSEQLPNGKKLRPSIAIAPGDELDEESDAEVEKTIQEPNKPKLKIKPDKQAKEIPPTKQEESSVGGYIPSIYEDYTLPSLDLLCEPEDNFSSIVDQMVKEKAYELECLLKEFSIQANVVNAEPGPAITMYELELAAGIKVSQISNLSNDIARALSAPSVRVVAPLPGKHTIGIEVPNVQREIVRMKDLVNRSGNKQHKMHIPLFLGKDSSGSALISDLTQMPHLLIAGTTGSGKSVCINTIITSILLLKRPDEVKLILVDPKMVEMTSFEEIPHLMCPIVTETHKAEQILEWATTKMDERYALLSEARVRNIADFNKLGSEEIIKRFNPSSPDEEAKLPKKLPYIVIIVDELADLMMTAGKEIEAFIVRLAQKSRAVGIHLVLATQRPQATVVTGLIKSNMPARISFRVAARMDSRIILDQNGGEALLGQGDMLFLKPGTSDLIRSQGAYLEDEEVNGIVSYIKTIAKPQYHPELMQLNSVSLADVGKDDLFDQAVDIVLETKRGSVSLLQRKLGIGYARASRIIEMMAAAGILGEYKGSQAREVLLSADEWDRLKKQQRADATAGYSDLQTDEDDNEIDEYDTPITQEDEYEEEEVEVEEEEEEEEQEYEEDDEDEEEEEKD